MSEGSDAGEWSGVSGATGTADAPNGSGSVEVKGNGLPAVRLKTFKGSKDEYENWKREIETIKVLYGLPDERLAPMMYLALEDSRGGPRELFKHVPIAEICSASGLKTLWQILDKEFERLPVQRADRAQQRFERARRRPFQSMDLYLRELRASLREFQADDPDSTISDLFLARKMLRNSGLSQSEQRSTLAAAGCKWNSAEIEQALLLMFPDAHVQDRSRLGTMRGQRPNHGGRPPWKTGKGKGGKGSKSKGTYVAEAAEGDAEVQVPDEMDDSVPSNAGDANIFEEEDLLLLDDDEEEEDESTYEEEELLEVYYQGQKAKHKLSKMKGRGRGDTRSIEEKKKGSKCGSCGQLGHWRGDASCPNVRSGKEKPFQKKATGTSSGGSQTAPPYGAHAVFVERPHDVFVISGRGSGQGSEWHFPDEDIAADGVQVDGFTFHRSTQTEPVPGLPTLQALKSGKGAVTTSSLAVGVSEVPEDLSDVQLERYTVAQLKRWLQQHGLPVSGKKDDLVTRVYEHWREQTSMIDGSACEHSSTVSGGNGTYSWRKCQHCRRMLYRVDKRSGLEEYFAGMQEMAEDEVQVQTHKDGSNEVIQSVDKSSFAVLFASKPKKLLCIPDSGCRRNVAGREWHQRVQRQLRAHGLRGIFKPEREKFRFGDSRVEESEGSWLYPVKKSDRMMVFNVACVNTDCPPLLSVSSMASLGVVINFVDNEIELRGLDTKVNMQHVASGHPVLEFDLPERADRVPSAFNREHERKASSIEASWEMPKDKEVHVLHSELVPSERGKLLDMLQSITIPPNRSRSKKLTGSDSVVVEHPPRSMLLGLYTKQGVGLSNHTEGKSELLKLIRRVARERVKDEEYTSIMINKMEDTLHGVALHRDMYNMAEQDNWVLQLGQFKGGRIWCEGAGRQQLPSHVQRPPSCPDDICGGYLRPDDTGWIRFNPQKWHFVEKVQGVRYSVVLFNSKYVSRAPIELWDRLAWHGFPCVKMQQKLARAEHCKEVPR
eukprot:6477628-Amphidinium_carterae.1